jgi:Fe2+ transport system protein FeoA
MNGKMRVVARRTCRETSLVNISDISRGKGFRCEPCPLNRVKAGVAVRIKRLSAAPEIQNRLREIGLGEEKIIRLLTSQANFICLVCNARLAISEQLASLILVEPVTAPIKF